MNFRGRDTSSAPEPGRGVRQGTATTLGVSGTVYRPRRRGASGRGILVVIVVLVVIVGAGLLFAAPAIRGAASDLARSNPGAMKLPFVSDAVKDDLGAELTDPGGTDATPIPFTIKPGDTPEQVAAALAAAGLIKEPLVFEYLVTTQSLDGKLQTGTFNLNLTMTPQQIADRLQKPPDPAQTEVTLALRNGLRLEQMAALLEAMKESPQTGQPALTMDVSQFLQEVRNPPADLVSAYPFLSGLPQGQSLEGFLGTGVFSIDPNITPDALVRVLLDRWQHDIGQSLLPQVSAKGKNLYQLLTIASIVERETGVDSERAKIAGVYMNRLNASLNPTKLLNADPTVIYAVDTQKLSTMPVEQWPQYVFWTTVDGSLNGVSVPADLQSYQTYQHAGLPAGPIDSPSLASIQAALKPDTANQYLYFYACPGSKTHKFARTLAQQQQNINSCK